MFRKGDVLQNKHTGNIVRLLREVYQNPEIKGILPVAPNGHVGYGSISETHWKKISYWVWFRVTIPCIIKHFFWRYEYLSNKYWGMVNPMLPNDYWKKYPPVYDDVIKPVTYYGYIHDWKYEKVLRLPAWREIHFHQDFETPLYEWLWRRLKHLL